MARKYDLISELYNRTAKRVVGNPESWQQFLDSACRNFKLRFDEQLLIFAQRPDATAVLEIERWNEGFGRWVNRGARGIAVFEDSDRSHQRLKHYFDVSDTHPSRYSRPVPIWQMEPEYEAEVIETLESTFGTLSEKDTLEAAILSAAKNAVEDNIPDYERDLLYTVRDSFLEELDEDMVTAMYRKVVRNSVAYMLMSRLGLDTGDYFERSDFEDIINFNTGETMNALGFATSDIAEMALTEIARTINSLNRKNRIIAGRAQGGYNDGVEITKERGSEHERSQLHDAGGLPAPEPEAAGAAGSNFGQVRRAEEEIPEGASSSVVLQSADELQAGGTSGGGRAEGDLDGGNAGASDGGQAGRDRASESGGHDGLGSEDEQSEELSAGDRAGGSGLRLSWHERSDEDKTIPFLGSDDDVNAILLATPHLKKSKALIRDFLEGKPDEHTRTDFIKECFNNDYTEVILDDGRRMGYKTYENVLHLWEGSYLSRTKQAYYDWGVIAAHFEGLRLLGELQDNMKPLPSMEGQQETLALAEEKSSAFSFSQEIIDAVLTRGSNVEEGKFRIYEQFQKSLSAKENIDFLKKEYGWGGIYPVITGTGIDEQHDGKGITLQRGFGEHDPRITLKWDKVEKRIAELIRLDRYLNPKEVELYPAWLAKQEERRQEQRERQAVREVLNTAPQAQEPVPEPEPASHYEYHLGDKVYFGADEFEILSLSGDRVLLYDTKFPLFQREETREDFERKVQENPLNDHLKVRDSEIATVPSDTPKKEIPEADDRFHVVELDRGYQTAYGIWDDEHNSEYVDEEGVSEEFLSEWEANAYAEKLNTAWREQPVQEKPSQIQEYSRIKEENPASVLLYQNGDSFVAYHEDAKVLGDFLGIAPSTQELAETLEAPIQIPSARLQLFINLLNDRGIDVAVSTLEDGKRATRNIVSTSKDDPVESQPVGRIDYLGTNGAVGESIEYTSEYQFLKDIKEENFYGSPMSIVLYRNRSGETISQDFLSQLDPPPQDFRVEDFVPNPERLMAQAKNLINEFCVQEYSSEADFSDLSRVGIAYTTITDKELEVQIEVDLIHYQIKTLVENQIVRFTEYKSLEYMVEHGLTGLSFDDLVSVPDRLLTHFLEEDEPDEVDDFSDIDPELIRMQFESDEPSPFVEQVMADVERLTAAEQEPEPELEPEPKPELKPSWEQKRTKVQTFDLHPDIPMSERHTFDLANNRVEEVNKKERFHRNYAAITVLKKCQSENRFATPEEQIILSKYVGWGGIPEVFDEGAGSWQTEYAMLKNILTPDEYSSARGSVLTAFYTPPEVITGIYKVMERMGFREGNILEPSCGIGNFIGMLPQEMQQAKVYGVEIDTISAAIAQQLYQRTSIAAQPFEEANIPDSFFDAVVGNVPFGDFRLADKRYDKHHFLIHDYFFAKSLDKLRPGGVMALVTSKGTMDKASPEVRKYIAQRADLLGAIRLPNNTFKGNAGTEVVSDILILQKRDRLIDLEPDWVHLDTDENGVKMNAYFVQHPEMILGEVKMVSGRFGEEMTVVPFEGSDLGSLLDEAAANIHGEITEYAVDEELSEEDTSIPADPSVRNFSYTVLDDTVYYRENSRMTPVTLSATAKNRVKGMIQIRDSVRQLLEMQTEGYPDEPVKAEQERLNRLYDSFTAKYGLINSRANVSAFSQDSSFSLISALEILDEEQNLERKADIFTKRTIKPHMPVTSVDTASEALAVSLGEKARIDMEYMCSLCGKTEEEVYEDLKGVIFLNPMYGYGTATEPKYLMADEYLSGNVREKLAWAKRSAEVYPDDFTVHVEALEKVQPKDLTASEIFVRLGTTWVPPEIIQQFIYEFLDTPRYAQWNIKVHYSQFSSEWNIEGKSTDRSNVKAYTTYGTRRINAYKIIEETLNLKDVRIFDYVEDADGKKKAVLNAKETAIAQAKQEQIKQGFQDWVWQDADRRELLCKIYNEKFNSTRPREYDGSHIVFSGMNPEIELREHQKNAVAHILYGGNTLLAHAVGAGKTYEMTAAAMESKRLGLCSKSLFVVPNHLTEQWAAEFLQLYPAANILVATKKDFETKNRKRFCGRIATGDYDAVIIGHSQFEKIPMSIERQIAILERERDEVLDGITELKANRGERFTIKQYEKSKKTIETKLKDLYDQSKKDDVVTFEELGIDRLFIDESHYYKNLHLYTKMRNVGGISQTEAKKSADLFMKCRYLDELTGGRGTVFATGTPISNSMVELYTIQRYLQYSTLEKHGLQHFDSWASSFGETITAVELKPEGTGYRTKTRFAKFFNLPELMSMFKEIADIKTADMLDLPVPEAKYHNIAVKPSEMQKEMVADLAERAERIRLGGIDPSVDNMLKITNDGRKLALDQRMMNPMLNDFEGSKLNACVDNIYQIWQDTSDKKSAQLVFCDLSTPKNNEEFSVYNDIRDKLIKRGIPADEIRFIHEADTEVKKQEMFKKVRRGEVRVLLGSTQKMGAGTNCQDKLIALHDIDCPWRPSDLEQRSGRIIRQGNENPEVDIYRYVTEGTFDAYLYQLIEGKQKFASQIMTSKSPVRSAEDIDATALSYAEIKMLATGNPHIKEKMDLDIQVQKLRLLKSNYLSEKYALEDKILKFYPQEIATLKETIAGLEADSKTRLDHPKSTDDHFIGMEVKGVSYSEKADAGKAILEACRLMESPDPVPLGKYRGFDMELSFNTWVRIYEVKVKGSTSQRIDLGDDVFGNISRIDNAIERIPDELEDKRIALEVAEQQLENAKVEVEKPFSQEEELQKMTARLNELDILLNLDKRENEMAGDEPDEGDMLTQEKDRGRER